MHEIQTKTLVNHKAAIATLKTRTIPTKDYMLLHWGLLAIVQSNTHTVEIVHRLQIHSYPPFPILSLISPPYYF